MKLFLVVARNSDHSFYAGNAVDGSPKFAPAITNAKVFFLEDDKDIFKYQMFAECLDASVMVFSYQPYSSVKQECTRLSPLRLKGRKVLPTAGWYPNGTSSFQYPHMVCARCGTKVVGDKETPPSTCPHCGLRF